MTKMFANPWSRTGCDDTVLQHLRGGAALRILCTHLVQVLRLRLAPGTPVGARQAILPSCTAVPVQWLEVKTYFVF